MTTLTIEEMRKSQANLFAFLNGGCGARAEDLAGAMIDLGRLTSALEQLEEAREALLACAPVGQEFCPWCWSMPPHKPTCPTANATSGRVLPPAPEVR